MCVGAVGITSDVVMDADADRVTPYVFWQLSPGDDEFTEVLTIDTLSPPGQVRVPNQRQATVLQS